MKSRWTNYHTAHLCIASLLLIGLVYLIFKISKFRKYLGVDLERQTPSTFEILKTQASQMISDMTTNNYFTIEELCKSNTAKKYNLNNTPTPLIEATLQNLIDKVLNPAREEYGSAIYVHSGYRSPEVNKKVGGVANSQHLTGEAADIDTFTRKGNAKVFEIIANQGNYDQLIWENDGDWIHVSCKVNGNNRKNMLEYKNGKYYNINANWRNVIK